MLTVTLLCGAQRLCVFVEQDMVTALRGELVDKETSLEEVKKAVKEVSCFDCLCLQLCCFQNPSILIRDYPNLPTPY